MAYRATASKRFAATFSAVVSRRDAERGEALGGKVCLQLRIKGRARRRGIERGMDAEGVVERLCSFAVRFRAPTLRPSVVFHHVAVLLDVE
eukprot:scaffold6009_cov248-Pinguiococcus_pyrenoidosus.AAC.3